MPRILTGHFTISGAVTGSERQIMLGRDVAALLSSVADPAWDYVAMGHIHKFQDLTPDRDDLPPVVYSGSMERIDFGEEGDPKGYVLVELEHGKGKPHYEFVPLQGARRFITLRVDIRRSPNPTTPVLEAIEKHDLEDAIVRVLITADPESDALLKTKLIEDAILKKNASTIAAIHREVERPERTRLGANPEGLTPPELLERYFKNREFPEEHIEKLMETAQAIFDAVNERNY